MMITKWGDAMLFRTLQLFGAASGLLLPSRPRRSPQIPAICLTVAPLRVSRQLGILLPSDGILDSTLAIVRAATVRVNNAGDATRRDSTADSALRLIVKRDSIGAIHSLAAIVVDSHISTVREASLAAEYYRTLRGAPMDLFMVEKIRFGFQRRGEVLMAVNDTLDERERAVVLGYACDAFVSLREAEADSTYWDSRETNQLAFSAEAYLRRSYELLGSSGQAKIHDAVQALLGAVGR